MEGKEKKQMIDKVWKRKQKLKLNDKEKKHRRMKKSKARNWLKR